MTGRTPLFVIVSNSTTDSPLRAPSRCDAERPNVALDFPQMSSDTRNPIDSAQPGFLSGAVSV
jgi:hypothetical protein